MWPMRPKYRSAGVHYHHPVTKVVWAIIFVTFVFVTVIDLYAAHLQREGLLVCLRTDSVFSWCYSTEKYIRMELEKRLNAYRPMGVDI